jgi:hypothetical protein
MQLYTPKNPSIFFFSFQMNTAEAQINKAKHSLHSALENNNVEV